MLRYAALTPPAQKPQCKARSHSPLRSESGQSRPHTCNMANEVQAITQLLGVPLWSSKGASLSKLPSAFPNAAEHCAGVMPLLLEEHRHSLRQALQMLRPVTAPYHVRVQEVAVDGKGPVHGEEGLQTVMRASCVVTGGSNASSAACAAPSDEEGKTISSGKPTATLRNYSLVLLSRDNVLPGERISSAAGSAWCLGLVAGRPYSCRVGVAAVEGGTGVSPPGGQCSVYALDSALSAAVEAGRGPAQGGVKRRRNSTRADGEWFMWELGHAVTALREVQALHALPKAAHPSLVHAIVCGKPQVSAGVLPFQVDVRRLFVDAALQARLEAAFTPAQFRAIMAAALPGVHQPSTPPMDAAGDTAPPPPLSPVCLIQGPPGTGKTTTLVATLNAVHVNAYNAFHETLLRGTKAVQAALAPQLQAGPTPPGDEAGPAPPPPPTPSGPSVGDAPPPDAKRPRPSVLRRTATPPGPSVLQKLLATQAGSSRHGSGVQRAKYALKPSPGLLHWLMRDESALADIGTLVRGSLSTKPRMLIVAPSNTAVDNIIRRVLSTKFQDGHGMRYTPPLLRLGRSGDPDVRQAGVVLHTRVAAYMDMPDDRLLVAEQRLAKDVHGLTQALAQLKHAAVTECRRQVAAALQRGAGEEERSAVAEGVAQAHAGHLLDLAKKHFAVAAELRRLKLVRRCRASGLRADVGAARDALRQECLAEAELVFATLSSSARSEIGEYTDASGLAFDVVVVDEAGQCTEASSLVPLQHGAQQLVLVGDPQQLPATVLSREAAEAGLDRSLFARLAEAGHVVHLLDTQYRMHPDIAAFPSKHFYEGRVGDAPSVCGPARQQLWHALPLMAPLRLLNVRIGAASTGTGGTSYSNLAEARAALALAAGLVAWRGSRPKRETDPADAPDPVPLQFSGTIGIFTPYEAQRALLRKLYKERVAAEAAAGAVWPTAAVDISTVDGAQGQERDVVILSTVRTVAPPAVGKRSRKRSIGFLKDVRRMNVALTRAKYALWVVASVTALRVNPDWAAFVQHCEAEGAVAALHAPLRDSLTATVEGGIIKEPAA